MKTCNKCNLEKPLELFSKSNQRTDGRTASCKVCLAKLAKQYRDAMPEEKIKEQRKKTWQAIKADPKRHKAHMDSVSRRRSNPAIREAHNKDCRDRSARKRLDPAFIEKAKERYKEKIKDPEYRAKRNEKATLRRKANPEKQKAASRRHYYKKKEADPNFLIESNRKQREEYAAGGKRKEVALRCATAWRKANPKKKYHSNKLREATKIQRTPAWADIDAIKAIYLGCPEGMHVDHIIPLRSKLVCGLHVENNLQYLTAKENMQKSNHFDPWTFVA